MRVSIWWKTILPTLALFLACALSASRASAQMDWTELEPQAVASREGILAKGGRLDRLIESGQYVKAVEYAYGEAAPLPKGFRKRAVDNAIEEIQRRYEAGRRAEAALEIMDLSLRFSQAGVLKRARDRLYGCWVADWREDVRLGRHEIQLPQEANGSMCVLARGLASWGLRKFRQDPQLGLAGMELARLYCEDGIDLAYNTGLAQYRVGRREAALETWAALASMQPSDSTLLSNLGWLALELGDVDQADYYAMRTLAADPESPNGLAIRLEVLFVRGQYREAAQTVFAHERQTVLSYEKRAVDYALAFGWENFRTKSREEALAFMEGLAGDFPQAEPFAQAAKAMKTALAGGKAEIPSLEALPSHRKPGSPIYPPDHGIAYAPLVIGQEAAFQRREDAAFALTAGVGEYRHMVGPAHAEQDARLFHDLLTGRMGFPDDRANIRMRLGKDAGSRSLREGIAWLARNASLNPNALVILYFSGKGAPVYGGGAATDCLLMPYDADPDHPENGLPISLTEIKEAFDGSGNPNVLLILDAGFWGDGKSIGLGRGIAPTAAPGLFDSGVAIATAAGVSREALEFPPGGQGAFSYFYFDALLGKGDLDEDGWVDSREAFVWASHEMKGLGIAQEPFSNHKPPVRLSKAP